MGHSRRTIFYGIMSRAKLSLHWPNVYFRLTLSDILGMVRNDEFEIFFSNCSPGAYVVPVNMNVNFWQHA